MFKQISEKWYKLILAATSVDPWPTTETKFKTVKKIYDETISSGVGKKMVVDMTKIVVPGTLTDFADAFVGYKNNTEETYSADSYLAFRCPEADNCVKLPWR